MPAVSVSGIVTPSASVPDSRAVTVTEPPSFTGLGAADRLTARAGVASSSLIVPVPVSVAVTVCVVPDTVRPTVNVSSPSTRASSIVATVKVRVSPAVPAKARAGVFAV